MKIHSHKISITDSEMEIIGDALCQSIKQEVNHYAGLNDLEDTKIIVEEELDLLYQLTNIGFKVWVDGGDGIMGKFECGTDVWFDKIYGDAVAKKEEGEVK